MIIRGGNHKAFRFLNGSINSIWMIIIIIHALFITIISCCQTMRVLHFSRIQIKYRSLVCF